MPNRMTGPKQKQSIRDVKAAGFSAAVPDLMLPLPLPKCSSKLVGGGDSHLLSPWLLSQVANHAGHNHEEQSKGLTKAAKWVP